MGSEPVACWTLPELAAQSALVLTQQDLGQQSGRVRDVPDGRTIRYYTTVGILDKPDHFQGRTAYYSHKHLMQLVAIKRMQAQGLTLSDIQARMLGVHGAELARLANMEPRTEQRRPGAGTRSTFWKTRPAPPGTGSRKPGDPQPAEVMHGVRLHAAVSLLLDKPSRALLPGDVEAIEAAAEPLIKLLRARRLIEADTLEES